MVSLEQGVQAPFTGYLFSPVKELEARNAVKNNAILIDINQKQKSIIDLYKQDQELYKQRIELYSKQNDTLAKENAEMRTVSTWERLGWFALGVFVAGGAAWGVSRVVR